MRVGANYVGIKKIIINDVKYLLVNKQLFIAHDRNVTVSELQNKSPGNEQPGEQGQRRSPGPGLRRQPKHFNPIVGTVCTPIDFVDSAIREQALRGAQPVGECTNRGHTSGPNC